MNWLAKIQNKPQAAKLKIIWTATIIVGIFLIAVWIVSSRYSKNREKDMTLFQSLENGFNDVKNKFRK